MSWLPQLSRDMIVNNAPYLRQHIEPKYHDFFDKLVAIAMLASTKGGEAAQEYARNNPLGGPATMFRAIAERIELGEDYHAVLRDYSVTVSSSAAPNTTSMTKIELAYCEWTGGHLSTDDFHKEIAEAVSDEWVVSSSAEPMEKCAHCGKAGEYIQPTIADAGLGYYVYLIAWSRRRYKISRAKRDAEARLCPHGLDTRLECSACGISTQEER